MGFCNDNKELIKSYDFNELIKQYILRENMDVDNIPTGKGKRLKKRTKKI